MKDLKFTQGKMFAILENRETSYKIRPHTHEFRFVLIDDATDKYEFAKLDDALQHAYRDGYKVESSEIVKFIDSLLNIGVSNSGKRTTGHNFDFGQFNILKHADKPAILKAVEKYGLDSKQVKALIKLYGE